MMMSNEQYMQTIVDSLSIAFACLVSRLETEKQRVFICFPEFDFLLFAQW
jgi:hypothetical protein